MDYKILPNILTVLRILLVLPCALSLYFGYNMTAIVIFVLASLTDGIDGFLARKLRCQSKLGAILDPIADKFLIVSLFFILTIKSLLPIWFAGVVIIREFILLSGTAFYRFMFGPVIFIPTLLSKLNTCLILFLLLLKLMESMSIRSINSGSLVYYLMITILFTSTYSCLDYIQRWSVRVYKSWQLKNKHGSY